MNTELLGECLDEVEDALRSWYYRGPVRPGERWSGSQVRRFRVGSRFVTMTLAVDLADAETETDTDTAPDTTQSAPE